MSLDTTFLAAFLAGLLSFVSPCVLPLVPPYLCFLAGVTSEQLTTSRDNMAVRAQIILRAVFFVLGFATVFIALGATASTIGKFVTQWLDWLAFGAGVLIIIFGLHFLGVFRIALFYRDARAQVSQRPSSIFGAYVIGLAFAFGWTPCVGPILAAILFSASATESVGRGALLLGVYAAGIGLPFLFAAMFASAFLGLMARFRSYMGYVEKAMGVLLVATGILFITGGMQGIAFWLLEAFPSLGQVG